MKLRNKKTGEIGELQITEKHYAVAVGNGTANCNVKVYCSLDKLNAEWEDYEEPKEYWFLSGRGEVKCIEDENTVFDKDHKFIGNYFETKEEAEKAVEKLKAWKRLKDKGLRFIGLGKDRYGVEDIKYHIELPTDTKGLWIIEDLNTCFSEEENE